MLAYGIDDDVSTGELCGCGDIGERVDTWSWQLVPRMPAVSMRNSANAGGRCDANCTCKKRRMRVGGGENAASSVWVTGTRRTAAALYAASDFAPGAVNMFTSGCTPRAS